MRDGAETPTTVEVTRGSPAENCSAAAASGTPCAAQARCIARTASRTTGPACAVGSRFERGPGGKGANQAIGARRLGSDVLFITRLGADAFGYEARSILLAEGLPEHGITTDAQSPTGIALIMVEDSGQKAIALAPGANLQLSAPDVVAASVLTSAAASAC